VPRPSLVLPLLAGLLAATALLAVWSPPVRLVPGSAAWTRLVGGAGPGGAMPEGGALKLPGLDRRQAALLLVEAEAVGGGAATVGVAFDGGSVQWLRAAPGAPAAAVLPATPVPGARVTLRRAPGAAAARLVSLEVRRTRAARPWAALALTFAAAAVLARSLAPALGQGGAFAAALALGAFIALSFTPALLWMTLPASGSRLAPTAALLGTALVTGWRQPRPRRRDLAFAVAVTAAFVSGAAVRGWFMPSAGSWDTEYWKGWTERMETVGLTRVYGEPELFDAERFLARMRGELPLQVIRPGITIDYPPLTMALLRLLTAFATPAAAGLDGSEARNVLVKTLPVLGDAVAVLFLLVAFRRAPRRALGLAALYWAAPPSWLASAVLGYLDGAYVPIAAAGLWMAGRGRAGWAGALLALAALTKVTALLALPAAAMALWAARAPLRRAVVVGLAVVAAAVLPFAAAGTLHLAVPQVFRIIFQKTFSGGFANPWWIAGHAAAVAQGTDWSAPVRFVRYETVRWPVSLIAPVLFALATAWVLRAQRRVPGPRAAALAGAAVVFAYGMLAVGVHENHPHALILLLVASGLFSRRMRVLFAGVAASYTANMLLLSGLGRFYGTRHLAVEPLAAVWPALRLLPGFDLTLALAVLNGALFALLLSWLPAELRRAEAGAP
jgi:hypothetical protein